MKKIDTKNLIKVALVIFALYLGIHYWGNAANVLKTLLGASIPLIVGAVMSYPLNILMSFYEKHLFPKSEKPVLVKSRRGLALTLALLTLTGILALIIALVVPQLTSCIKLLIAEVPTFFNMVVEKLSEFEFVPDDIISALSKIDWKSRITDIIKTVYSGLGSVMDVVVTTVSSVVSGVTTAFLAIIFAIYLLLGKDKIGSQVKRVMHHFIPEKFTMHRSSYPRWSLHRWYAYSPPSLCGNDRCSNCCNCIYSCCWCSSRRCSRCFPYSYGVTRAGTYFRYLHRSSPAY